MTRTATFGQSRQTIRSDSALSVDQMRRVAPSIFAEQAHSSRSERYAYIPTSEVLAGLQKEGFDPFEVTQSVSKIPGKSDFTKHMVRLRYRGEVAARSDANEIILVNSHDGTSSYQMLAGVFRFVCSNGMVCGDIVEDVRIKHTGKVVGEVIDTAFRVVDNFVRVDESKDAMRAITLSDPEQRLFAEEAAKLRFGVTESGNYHGPILPAQLLTPRRFDDRGNDLWSTFNRVQENSIRGGLHGRTVTGRRQRTREVGAIDRSIDINRALWSLAEGMRKLKA